MFLQVSQNKPNLKEISDTLNYKENQFTATISVM